MIAAWRDGAEDSGLNRVGRAGGSSRQGMKATRKADGSSALEGAGKGRERHVDQQGIAVYACDVCPPLP